jgi:hypothetical protein
LLILAGRLPAEAYVFVKLTPFTSSASRFHELMYEPSEEAVKQSSPAPSLANGAVIDVVEEQPALHVQLPPDDGGEVGTAVVPDAGVAVGAGVAVATGVAVGAEVTPAAGVAVELILGVAVGAGVEPGVAVGATVLEGGFVEPPPPPLTENEKELAVSPCPPDMISKPAS